MPDEELKTQLTSLNRRKRISQDYGKGERPLNLAYGEGRGSMPTERSKLQGSVPAFRGLGRKTCRKGRAKIILYPS